jgi:hypothetical protein
MEHTITLDDNYEGLLAFSGMTVESIVIDKLNQFIGPKRDHDEQILTIQLRQANPDDVAELSQMVADAIAQKNADRETVIEAQKSVDVKTPLVDDNTIVDAKTPKEPVPGDTPSGDTPVL